MATPPPGPPPPDQGPPPGPGGPPPGGPPPGPPPPPPKLAGDDEVQQYMTARSPVELQQMLDASGMTTAQKKLMWDRVAQKTGSGGAPPTPNQGSISSQLALGPQGPQGGGEAPQVGMNPLALPSHIMPLEQARQHLQVTPDGQATLDGGPQGVRAVLSHIAQHPVTTAQTQLADALLMRMQINEASGVPWEQTKQELLQMEKYSMMPAGAWRYLNPTGQLGIDQRYLDAKRRLDQMDPSDPGYEEAKSEVDFLKGETAGGKQEAKQKGTMEALQTRMDAAMDRTKANLEVKQKIADMTRQASWQKFQISQGNMFTRQDRGAIEKAMDPTTQEKSTLDTVTKVAPTIDRMMTLLEPIKDDNSLGANLEQRFKALGYKEGFATDFQNDLEQLAFLRSATVREYMNGSRNLKVYEDAIAHMPAWERDNPALMYNKLQNMKTILGDLHDGVNQAIDQRVQDKIGRIHSTFGGGPAAPPKPPQSLAPEKERKQFRNNQTGQMEWFTREKGKQWQKE